MVKTEDLSIFKVHPSNRSINERALIHLIESIIKNNLLHLTPIIVNENMEVIDGQHRLEACRRLNLPIYYRIYHSSMSYDMALLNIQKNWRIEDYVHFFANSGREDYKELQNLSKKMECTIPTLARYLSFEGSSTGEIRKGVALNKQRLDFLNSVSNDYIEIRDQLKRDLKFVEDKIKQKIPDLECFKDSLISILRDPRIDVQRLKDKMRTHFPDLVSVAYKEIQLKSLREIYNKNSRREHRINFTNKG